MSIYATTLVVADDEHADGCPRLVEAEPGILDIDPARPCTCGAGPIAYRGSHVLPDGGDPRQGVVMLAAIPGFIAGPGRPALHDGPEDWPYHPWLRLSVADSPAGKGDCVDVVLDRGQVEKLHAELGRWLESTDD